MAEQRETTLANIRRAVPTKAIDEIERLARVRFNGRLVLDFAAGIVRAYETRARETCDRRDR